MATISIPKRELKTVVKESIREVLEQESMKLRALLTPLISQKEQKDIEKRYGRPSQKITRSEEVQI
jgi:hypothetical protein